MDFLLSDWIHNLGFHQKLDKIKGVHIMRFKIPKSQEHTSSCPVTNEGLGAKTSQTIKILVE